MKSDAIRVPPNGDELHEIGGPPSGAVEDAPVSKPAPKRRKGGKWTQSKQDGRRIREARKARLEARFELKAALVRDFMQLPLDVILEMFSHLHPKTLLAISRTNKGLRSIILSQRHIHVWVISRNDAAIPRPPKGFSEPRWASLLFDTPCQACWKFNTELRQVNWYWLKRVCHSCRTRHVVPFDSRTLENPSLMKLFLAPTASILRQVDIEIARYIRWGQYLYPGEDLEVFWRDDVVEIVNAWQELSKFTDKAGREAFHRWKTDRRDTIRKNLAMIPAYELWRKCTLFPSKWQKRQQELRSAEERKYTASEEIKARLKEAGHRTEDIDMVRHLYPSPRAPGDADKVWASSWSRRLLEDEVRDAKNFRVALEMEPVTQERLLILKGVYERFLDTLQPLKRYHCPEVSALRTNDQVGAILDANKAIEITPAHFQPIVDKLPVLMDEAHRMIKEKLISERRSRSAYLGGTAQPWDLAGNVFQRCRIHDDPMPETPGNCVLVGWDMIATHSCKWDSKVWLRPGVIGRVPRAFEINPLSSNTSRWLIKLAGWPPLATVEEMDAADPRFVCERSECTKDTGETKVFTWRAAIAHFGVIEDPSSNIRMATMEETRAARENDSHAREGTKAWSCNHCPEYLDVETADTKAAVLTHLDQKHGISNPIMPRDYFVNERCRHTYEVPYTIHKETAGATMPSEAPHEGKRKGQASKGGKNRKGRAIKRP